MQNPYSEGDYVDCKHQGQGWWCVARVVAKDGDQLRIKFDGMASKNDITIRWNNPRVAPFRRYTVGYTGNPKSIRDDKELEISNAEDISTLIDVFSQKNYQQFEATKINQTLRGKVFLFTDTLLSQIYVNDFPEPEYINAGLEYLQKFLTFAITYLRNFPKHFINFTEGSLNPQLLMKKSEVAYSFYIYELVSSLVGIFGGSDRCSRFYKQICQQMEPDELNFKPSPPVLTKDTLNPHMEEEMTSSTGIGELYNRHTTVDKIKINFANSMIEKFAAAGGFKALLNLIYSENEEENGLLGDRSTTTKGNYFVSAEEGHVAAASGRVKYGCPMQVAEEIVGLVKSISGRFKEQYRAQFLGDFKQRLYKRIKSISDVEIKELEIEQVQSLFRAMEEFLLQVADKETIDEFYEFKEMQSLNLYLRLMDSPSFEKKLKGINGIREYVAKLESAQDESDDPKAQKETLKHVDADKFTEWVLENKIIELIYEKYMHIELIKRSIEIQKFIAENAPDFPQHLIDFMWNSIKDKHEEVKKVIYENLVELAPCVGLSDAQEIFNKFLQVKYENYDEDFVDLIGRFTQKGLRLIVLKTKDDSNIRVNEAISLVENPQFLGVSLMFNLIMDDSPLSTSLSIRVLEYLQEIISEYPAVDIFLPIVEECLKNLEKDVSIYQSLLIMKEYLTKMQALSCYQETCENYFQKFQENHNIIDYLTKNIESYFQKVRQRVQIIKSSRKPSLNGTHHQDNLLQKECFIGKFSHEQNILQRIDSLRYFIAHPYLDFSLSIDQFKQLWDVFVKQPNFHFETTLFLQFIGQLYTVPNKGLKFAVAIPDIKEVLLQILQNKEYLDIRDLTPEKLNCIEFYFVIANIHAKKLQLDQSEGFNLKNLVFKSNNVYKLDMNPIGLSYFWECLVECPDKDLAERVTSFLVDLSTRVDKSLNLDQEAICSQVVHDIMTALKGALEQKNFSAIERYIMFLDKFFDRFENRTGKIFLKIHNTYSSMATSSQKVGLHVKLLPYNIPTKIDLNLKDRIGYIREVLANHYDLDNTDFQLTICGTQIRNDDLLKELVSFYSVQNPLIQMVKKPASELHLDFKSFAVKEREYVEIFFEIFSTMINSEHLKNVWDFVQKLPLQKDIKQDFSELDSYIDVLNGENQLHGQNIFRTYYYLSLIQSLSLTDEYYWKWKAVDVHAYKGEWAYHFENNQGIEWLAGLVLNTDFSQISNFLYIKTLLILSKLLWLYLDFSENDDQMNHDFINSQFLTKCLDIFRYSSIYISSIPSNPLFRLTSPLIESSLSAHVDVIKDHSLMCRYLSEVIQKLLKANHNHYQVLLRYPEFENLLTQVFLKLPHEETPHYDGQESFVKVLSLLFQTLQKSPQKQNSLGLLNLLFEDIFFKSLDSGGPSYIILRFLGSILNEYDLKTDFGCDIDVLSIMIQVANFIKSHQRGKGFVYETKLGICFFMLQKFLERNPDQILFFGQEQGLVQEILTQGILKAPNMNGEDGPKYQNKSNLVQAFELLAVFAKDQTNFKAISEFLLSIHSEGIWRSNKPSSWFISANIRRRSDKYAGLKNLGCTCYMNSTLQQLFMIPSFKKHLPMLQDPKFDPAKAHDNLLFQLKRLFYGMNHIDQEYFSPKQFCLAFKDIDGSPTSFIEQKDAFEFLSLFMDRIEEQLKGTKYANIIKAHFGGLYSNELICKGCPHYYEREEPFLALNLTVKNKRSIKDGLERLIEGEILDGDNAYYCEQCKAKVKTIKRTSIKKLPPYLFLNLQRFEYNFDLNIRVKVNDFCEFPMELDMTPYTQQHLSKTAKTDTNSKTLEENDHAKYTLKGVVIHMGTADSGHYYSIIRDRKSDDSGDTWIEFNDEKVSEFNMNNLPNIAFGDREGCPTIQSAYVLVYEKKEQSEDLQKLEEEIHAQGSTTNREEEIAMQNVVEEVRKRNKMIFYISNIFSAQYPAFIQSLIKNYEEACSSAEGVVPVPTTGGINNQSQSLSLSHQSMEDEDDPQIAKASFRSLFSFVWVVYCTSILRMDDRVLSIQKTFFEWLYSHVLRDTQNCIQVLEYFVNHDFFTEMLLQNPHQRSRRFLVSLITKAFRKIYKTEKAENYLFEVDDRGSPISACANFLSSAINLLDTTKLYLQTLGEYFYMFIAIIKIDFDLLQYLLSKDFLGRLLTYFFMHRDGEGKDQYPELNFFEYNLPIEYNSEITSPYREWKEDDFMNSNTTNLAYFFQLVWKLVRYTSAPAGQGQNKRMHYNSKVNYILTSKETRLLNLTTDQIIEMIDSIDGNNKRLLKDVCKIIAWASFNSINNSNACCKHIMSELESDTENERTPELFALIRELASLKDSLQHKRNRTILRFLVQTMGKRADDFRSLDALSGFLAGLINTNPSISNLMETNQLHDEVINALQNYCLKSNHLHTAHALKPISFQLLEQRKNALKGYIRYFEDRRDQSDREDPGSDFSSQSSVQNYKRQQPVQYYDSLKKKWRKGIVEDTYEDVVKVKKTRPPGSESPEYEWFDNDDTSYLQPEDNSEIEQENDGPAIDLSTKEFGQDEDYTTDELSVRPNSAASSPDLD